MYKVPDYPISDVASWGIDMRSYIPFQRRCANLLDLIFEKEDAVEDVNSA